MIKLLALLLLFAGDGAAKDNMDSLSALVLKNLITVQNKPAVVNYRANSVYMIVTSRSCDKCFQDICNFYKDQETTFYIVVYMPRDLMQMIQAYSRYLHVAGCVKEVYYFWTDGITDERLLAITDQPSPQLMILKDGIVTYKDYTGFLNLVEKK